MYQILKYIFVRIGLTFFLLVTLGFFTLYFIHEVALPGAVFNDSFVQWLIFIVCIVFGFFAYGLIGEQRFYNAMHKFKDIPSTAVPLEVIGEFQAVVDYTYSSNFLPGLGRRLRNSVIMRFADYLLFAGQDDDRAQKIYLNAFLLEPKSSPYRTPLISILERGGDLTDEEIDLLLVILKAGEFHDDAIVNHLASIFLRKCIFTRKTEPVFLSAIERESEYAKEIVDFVLPELLEKKRSDSFALSFYLAALSRVSSEGLQVREIVARAYCQGIWKGINLPLHEKCGEVFQELNFKWRSDIMKEVADSKFSSKVRKIDLFSKDNLLQLKNLKVRFGLSKPFLGSFKDGLRNIFKVLIDLVQTFVLSLFKPKTWVFIFGAVVILMGVLNYRERQAQQEKAIQKEQKIKGSDVIGLDKREELKIYTLQVAAFTSPKQAHALIDSLRKKGVRDVYQVKTKRKSGEIWYKIRVGRFDSNENARRFANQLISQKSIKNYFVISLPVN